MEVKLAAWKRAQRSGVSAERRAQRGPAGSSGAWIMPQRWSHLEAEELLVPQVSQAPAVALPRQGGCSVMFPASGSHAAFWRQRWL